MTRVTRQDLEHLWNQHATPCISLFLPTEHNGTELLADPIRLKNLAREAHERLLARGLRDPDARALLAPVDQLIGNQPFWKAQRQGLALFVAPDRFDTLRLSRTVTERVVVGTRFHTRPLLDCLADAAPFHVLALSLNAVRLLRATAESVVPVALPGAPRGLKDFLKYEEKQPDFQYHSSGQGGSVSGGGGQADRKDEQRRYLRAVDHVVCAALNSSAEPVVLAGVESLLASYRELSACTHLVATSVSGNPDHESSEALRDRALEVLRPLREAEQALAADEYRRLAGTGRTTAMLERVLTAAQGGRVETLFVRNDAERWGTFESATGSLTLHEPPVAESDELLDLAASLTARSGGRVLPMPAALLEQPEISDGAAAILRY